MDQLVPRWEDLTLEERYNYLNKHFEVFRGLDDLDNIANFKKSNPIVSYSIRPHINSLRIIEFVYIYRFKLLQKIGFKSVLFSDDERFKKADMENLEAGMADFKYYKSTVFEFFNKYLNDIDFVFTSDIVRQYSQEDLGVFYDVLIHLSTELKKLIDSAKKYGLSTPDDVEKDDGKKLNKVLNDEYCKDIIIYIEEYLGSENLKYVVKELLKEKYRPIDSSDLLYLKDVLGSLVLSLRYYRSNFYIGGEVNKGLWLLMLLILKMLKYHYPKEFPKFKTFSKSINIPTLLIVPGSYSLSGKHLHYARKSKDDTIFLKDLIIKNKIKLPSKEKDDKYILKSIIAENLKNKLCNANDEYIKWIINDIIKYHELLENNVYKNCSFNYKISKENWDELILQISEVLSSIMFEGCELLKPIKDGYNIYEVNEISFEIDINSKKEGALARKVLFKPKNLELLVKFIKDYENKIRNYGYERSKKFNGLKLKEVFSENITTKEFGDVIDFLKNKELLETRGKTNDRKYIMKYIPREIVFKLKAGSNKDLCEISIKIIEKKYS